MIKLPISKDLFVKFLAPISRLGDKAVIKLYNNTMYTLAASEDNNIILYALAKTDASIDNATRLNIPDVKKLLRAIDCLDSNLIFTYKSNYILCETSELNGAYFKYHVVDDNVIKDAPISAEKISKLNFDTDFIIESKKLTEISRASSFAVDTKKIYLYTKDENVFCELADHETQNTDSITLKISDSFTGQPIKNMLPLVYEVFRNLTSLKCENVKVKINNEYKVIMFSIGDSVLELKYIISTLVK